MEADNGPTEEREREASRAWKQWGGMKRGNGYMQAVSVVAKRRRERFIYLVAGGSVEGAQLSKSFGLQARVN